jgi:hypothetical protein
VAGTVRVRVHWTDGRIEALREPLDAAVTTIVRTGTDGRHHYFEVTDDLDQDGFVIAREVPSDA